MSASHSLIQSLYLLLDHLEQQTDYASYPIHPAVKRQAARLSKALRTYQPTNGYDLRDQLKKFFIPGYRFILLRKKETGKLMAFRFEGHMTDEYFYITTPDQAEITENNRLALSFNDWWFESGHFRRLSMEAALKEIQTEECKEI